MAVEVRGLGWMLVARGEDREAMFRRVGYGLVEGVNDAVAVWYRQRAARTEIILHIDDQERSSGVWRHR